MANVKITDLPALGAKPDDADLIEIVDDVAGTPTSKKVLISDLMTDKLENIVEDTTPQLYADLDGQGNYAVDLQNFPDMLSNGPGYWFDGVDDYVNLGTDTDLDLGTGDGSYIIGFKSESDTGDYIALFDTALGGDTQSLLIDFNNGLSLRGTITENTVGKYVEGTSDITADGKNHVASFTIDRDSVTGLKLYLDGKEESYTTQEDPTSLTGAITPTGAKYIGIANDGSSNPFSGNINLFQFWNLNLTAAEVKAFSNGAAIPYKYIGASQTVLTSGTLTIGKRYRIVDWITNDDFTNIGGTNEDGNEFTATGTTPTTWTNSSTVVQIGCVLDLNPTGITASTWYDQSGNGLNGTVSGAVAFNKLPVASNGDRTAILNNGQIAFPATAVPSADPNTLDDYEEGTWTPHIGGDATYNGRYGRYVKVGKMVTVQFSITINTIGTGSTGKLSGLPFVSENIGDVQTGSVGYFLGLGVSRYWLGFYVENSTTTMLFVSTTGNVTGVDNGTAVFANGTNIHGSVTYMAA